MSKSKFAGRALRVAAASGIVLGVLAPTAAFAADYPVAGAPPRRPTRAPVAANTATNSSTLPFTGSDVGGLVAIGAGAALAGVVMVRHSRRHPHHRLTNGRNSTHVAAGSAGRNVACGERSMIPDDADGRR